MTLAAIAFLKTFAPAVSFAILFLAERARPAVPAPRGDGRLLRNASLWLSMAVASPLAGMPLTAFAATHAFWLRPDGAPTLFWFAADLVILDCWTYFAHRAYHRIPMMWRLHAPHHLDEHLDTTSAGRFHPLEIIFSALIRMPLIAALAMPLAHVLLFDMLLLLAALFHHSNLRIPQRVERALSQVIVTPSIHWVHHHAQRADTNSNYSGIFSVWDGLFGSRSFTKRTPDMQIGIEGLCDRTPLRLLLAPFGAPFR